MGKTIELSYDGSPFEVYEVAPKGATKGGLIVIEEVWGLTDHIKGIADRYAAEGYHVISPELLSETHIKERAGTLMLDYFNPEKRNEAQPKLRELMTPMHEPGFGERTVGRLKVCFDYLYDKPELKGWVAVTGFCFGGSYSYALATAEPKLKAAVPFYGHADFKDTDALKRIACPMLAFYGENDENLMRDLPAVEASMKDAGVDFTDKVYSDCGHAFFNDTNPYAYDEVAATVAWQCTLDFLASQQ